MSLSSWLLEFLHVCVQEYGVGQGYFCSMDPAFHARDTSYIIMKELSHKALFPNLFWEA